MLDLKKIEAAINQISAEKKISKEAVMDIIEAAIRTAYKKDYGSKDEKVNVSLDLEAGTIDITLEKVVVKQVENPAIEISIDEAPGFEEWDMVEIDVTDDVMWDSFWRIASQAARNVIMQKIGDSEKQKVYDLFKDKVGETISMKVVMVESGKVIFDYMGNQVILPKSEQVSRDNYVPDARFYIYVSEVKIDEKTWPRVVLSRKNKNIVASLFEMNVPEIADGTISIDYIVRYPWVKTKILVSSQYDEIDPAGSLIGSKWIRVKSIMEELSWEKIDIIVDNGNIPEMISKSLTPAKVQKVEVDEENKQAHIYVDSEQRAKAIGKWGININLASDLTWYTLSLIETENVAE